MTMARGSDDQCVLLKGGLALRVEPLRLLVELEERGFRLRRDGDDILITPASKLTDADRCALRRWKAHVLAIIDYECPVCA